MRRRYNARAAEVRVADDCVYVFLWKNDPLDPHVTESVEREFGNEDPFSLDHENVCAFGASITFGIKSAFV